MACFTTTRLVALFVLVGTCLAQQNYVEDYEDEPQPQAQTRPIYRPQSPLRLPSQAAAPKPTPVPILKQINRHNEDGSYTYGYEGADGSFKIETKLPTGEVMGKYGYVDDTGKVRVVEYGANKFGFQPAGEGITVPPPTLVEEKPPKKVVKGGRVQYEYDDGEEEEEQRPIQAPVRPQRPQYVEQQFVARARPQPQPQPQHQFVAQPRPQYAPQPAPQAEPQFLIQYSRTAAPRAEASPVPPRPVIPGAVPVGRAPSVGPTPPRPVIPGAAPAPVREDYIPQPRPAPLTLPVPSRPRSQPNSNFDQLYQQYAFQGGRAVADFAFHSK